MKPISTIKIIFSGLLVVTLAACAHNAPAPVIDATLNPVLVGSQQNNRLRHSESPSYQKSDFHSSYQKADPYVDTSFAIADIPRGTEVIKNANRRTSISSAPDKPYIRLDVKQPDQHEVKPGETLFAIAWQYSVDHKELAKINHIQVGKIYPGQILKLRQTSQAKGQGNGLGKLGQSNVFNKSSLLASLDRDILSEVRKSDIQKSDSKKHKPNKSNKASKKSQNIKTASLGNKSIKRWLWPVNGRIIQHFSNRGNSSKGLDIAAKRGAPVRATANGKVVYSGSGLRGYGQLVIIKHNDLFLSAYAHNEKLHVQENEFVKAGQKIADLGSSGSNKDKLHFEIRFKGKPVDPLNYLPKSGQLAYR